MPLKAISTMRGIVAGLALWLAAPAAALAQGVVQQSGPVVPFHPAVFGSNGVIMDGGTNTAPAISTLALFNGSNCPMSVSSQAGPGVSLSPSTQFTVCQSLTTTTLSFLGLNGASAPAVVFDIGGVNYPFPGPGNGNVLGPASAVNSDFTCFNTTSGTLLKDCGFSPGNVAITGGAINNVAIGGVTPAAGTFTGLTASTVPYIVEPNNTASPSAGLIYDLDASWNPSGPSSQFNNYNLLQFSAVSLSGGTVAQRWASQNNPYLVSFTTTGPPTGTPASPTGMADSHAVGFNTIETIPAGLCDGQNGSGFSGPGGAPNNNCYQEIGSFDSTLSVLSPGHYAESFASAIYDNVGGSGAVPIRAVGFLSNINKADAAVTYPMYGFQADSTGAQQTTDAPTAAYRVDGGWQIGLDLTGLNYTGAIAIALPSGPTITSDSSHIYLSVSSVQALVLSSTVGTFAGTLQATNYVGAVGTGSPSTGQFTSVAATTYVRPGTTLFAGLSTADPSPQVGDMLNITDASACTVNTAVAAGGGTVHSCPTVYNGASWVAMVTH
jgi:hypothetical protein